MSVQSTSSMAPSSAMAAQQSPWHSPVPYLFAGLAAMLGLIAFALLILVCSCWKLSGFLDNGADGEGELESRNADPKPDNNDDKTPPVFEEKYLVIMAGQAKPTFLATPRSSRASSFGSSSCRSNSTVSTEKSSTSEVEMVDECEKDNQGSSDRLQVRNMENQEIADQRP